MARTDKTFSTIEQRKLLCENLSFAASEAYKLLRANLSFTIADCKDTPVVAITSSLRGEAKTTTAINLSYTMAETGKKILLIDGDMRLPNVARALAIEKNPGLSEAVVGDREISECIRHSNIIDGWDIMPSGTIPPNPSELLNSESMEKVLERLKKMYDFIVIDLPPIGIVSDALVISGIVDGFIVIARQDYTSKKIFAQTIAAFEPIKDKVLGIVLTDSSKNRKSYYKKNKYRYYSKRYESGKSYGYGYGYGYGYAKNAAKSRKKTGDKT